MREKTKRRLFGVISAVIGVALSVAAIEGLAILWLMAEDGRYTPAAELFERTQNTYVRDLTRGTNCRYVDTLFPHPYVGFVHHANQPCGLKNVNNVGLFNDDYPLLKRPDRYTILLTGGSVAGQLAQLDPWPAPHYLEEELNNEYESPNGQPFWVLNGGDGAWKQPQPFILFALNAQALDAVITLGGMNDYYLFRPWERERLEYPISNFTAVNPLVADDNFGDAAIGWVLGRVAGGVASDPMLGQSHAAYVLFRALEAAAKGRTAWRSTKRTTLESLFALPADIAGDGERVFASQLELLEKYNRAMEALARDYGIRTAYFFQPVPAYGKTLTAEEQAIVGDLSYIGLYRRMVDGVLHQRELGLAVFDLGDLFVDVKETVYADGFHLQRSPFGESLGYRLMAKRVAADVASAWGLRRKQPATRGLESSR
jgi:hypothetical protein